MIMADQETPTSPLEPVMPPDILVCGLCQRSFSLSSLQDFMQHKLFDCQGVIQKTMICQSCPEKFQTPWTLLQHAQNTHALKIFLEQGPYSGGITSVQNKNASEIFTEQGTGMLEKSTQCPTVVQDTGITSSPVKINTKSITGKCNQKSNVQLKQQLDESVGILNVSTHKVITGISNVTTQTSPQIMHSTSGANVLVSSTQLANTNPLLEKAADKSVTTTCLSKKASPVVSIIPLNDQNIDTVEESIANLRPDLIIANTGAEATSVLSAPIAGSNLSQVIKPQCAHLISVLRPIKLPPGAIVSTALHMNKASQPSMTFTMLPHGVPLAKVRTTSVQIQKAPISSFVANLPPKAKLPCNGQTGVSGLKQITLPVKVSSTCCNAIPVLSTSNGDSTMESVEGMKIVTNISDKAITKLTTVKETGQSVSATISTSEQNNLNETCLCKCCRVGKCCVTNVKLCTESQPVDETVSNSSTNAHCCDAAVQAGTSEIKTRKRKDSTSKNGEENDENLEEDVIRCCNNQDCGVTIMPGTHEGLKKCCNAVVPKKRKQHMETKHQYKKQCGTTSDPPFSDQNTIYINIQSNASLPQVSTSAACAMSSIDGTQETITVNAMPTSITSGLSAGDGNPSSLTLSIPVSYTRQSSCSDRGCGRPSGSSNVDCGCGCCPGPRKFQLTSVRDKKLKTSRRLSTSTADTRGEDLFVQNSEEPDLTLRIKPEAGDYANIKKETNKRISGLRKMIGIRSGGVGKKRRYPTSRPFKCDQCDDAFNQRIHLKKHQSKHTGIKPFKCEQCDYSTVERSHLKVHIRVHTGEKPYKCSCCEYATAQNSTLKIHLKRHHGDGSGDTSFSCSMCGCEFEDEAPFIQHQQQQHQQQEQEQQQQQLAITGAENSLPVPEEDLFPTDNT